MLIKFNHKNELNEGIHFLIVAPKTIHGQIPVFSIQSLLTLIWMWDWKKDNDYTSFVKEVFWLSNLDRTSPIEMEFLIFNFEFWIKKKIFLNTLISSYETLLKYLEKFFLFIKNSKGIQKFYFE